ncbi:hypothetical protein J2W23_001287 [Variovorax boronicumulans]|nr:hypothetical protein [Variovorax boronicumulans]
MPLSLEALMHAIELNGVAVAANQSAFSLGRLAAGNPTALDQLRAAPMDAQAQQADERPLDALLADARRHLTGYQSAAWAARFAGAVERQLFEVATRVRWAGGAEPVRVSGTRLGQPARHAKCRAGLLKAQEITYSGY